MTKYIIKSIILFTFLLYFNSISISETNNEAVILKGLAKQWWDARVQEDWKKLYKLLSSSDKREITKEQFISSIKGKQEAIRFVSYKLGLIETDGDMGWVDVKFVFQPTLQPQMPTYNGQNWDVWRKEKGKWYPVLQDKIGEYPKLPPHLRSLEEEAKLKKRASEFWEAKENKNWELIYQYCDPKFKARIAKDEFLNSKSRLLYLSHKINWVETNGNKGKVRITYTAKISDPYLTKLAPVKQTIIEDWIKVEDQWFFSVNKVESIDSGKDS